MPTLYRKYRPQTFGEIVGQDHIVSTLQAALEKQRVAHAYLFHGARGTGKTTTARVLASALGVAALDVIEIDAASNRGIDDIRSLRDGVALAPTQSPYKVYIIDEVHMLTKEAFAALLKTLEEPVRHAIFILATTELHKVPATIVSRCQVFRFRRATPEDMRRRLTAILAQENRKITDDAMEFLIARADGCYRDAESLLGQVLTWREGEITAEGLAEFLGLPPRAHLETFLQALIERRADAALAAIEDIYAAGIDIEQFIQEAVRTARDAAVELTKGTPAPAFATSPEALARMPEIIRALLTAVQDLAYVPEPRLALQLAVLSVSKLSSSGEGEKKEGVKLTKPVVARVHPTRTSPHVTGGDSSKLQKVWAELITNMKLRNPVASTFLRAIEPAGLSGEVVTTRVQYAIHRNFFEKPENRAVVEEELGKLLGQTVTIRFQLEETTTPVRQQEEDLYRAVKEVFQAE